MTEETKVCLICKVQKPIGGFRILNSRGKKYITNWCIECNKEYKKNHRQQNKDKIKQYQKRYLSDNKERIRDVKKKYRDENRDEMKDYLIKYREENREKLRQYNKSYRFGENREKVLEGQRKCGERRKEEINHYRRTDEEYKKKKRLYDKRYREKHYDEFMSDPHNRIRIRLSKRIRQAVKEQSGNKCAKSSELLGCDIFYFIKYLESKFLPGMLWENYGEWHIDHILPCAAFDLTKPEEQLKCFHYTNLQPLWMEDNCRKSDKIEVFTSEGVFFV